MLIVYRVLVAQFSNYPLRYRLHYLHRLHRHYIMIVYIIICTWLKEIIQRILDSNIKILKEPKPSIDVIALTDVSVKLAIRPWVNHENFSSVYSEILESCKSEFHDTGIVIKA